MRNVRQSFIKEIIDDQIKWYCAKAGQSDYIRLVRLQLANIIFQLLPYSSHE